MRVSVSGGEKCKAVFEGVHALMLAFDDHHMIYFEIICDSSPKCLYELCLLSQT